MPPTQPDHPQRTETLPIPTRVPRKEPAPSSGCPEESFFSLAASMGFDAKPLGKGIWSGGVKQPVPRRTHSAGSTPNATLAKDTTPAQGSFFGH